MIWPKTFYSFEDLEHPVSDLPNDEKVASSKNIKTSVQKPHTLFETKMAKMDTLFLRCLKIYSLGSHKVI